MDIFLKISFAAGLLILAVSVPLGIHLAFAEQEDAPDATAVAVNQNEASLAADAAPSDAKPVEAGASDQSSPSNANSAKNDNPPEQKKTPEALHIPSSNPDDVNKHPAWRKREANKAISELRKLKGVMMQQGTQ